MPKQTKFETPKIEVYVSKLTGRYRLNGKGGEWKTYGGAVRAATRRGYEVTNTQDPMIQFLAKEKKTRIVTNLLSGKLVRIPANTPLCCDPSSETYWSS